MSERLGPQQASHIGMPGQPSLMTQPQMTPPQTMTQPQITPHQGMYTPSAGQRYSHPATMISTMAEVPGSSVNTSNTLSSAPYHSTYPNVPMEERVHYVEVPVVHEEVIHVPRKEVIEVEKKVPIYEVQVKERLVEVPQVETINTEVEVEQIQEVIRRVPVKQRIEVPKEVIKYVTKVVTNVVEQEVEVPGEMIQVPKPYKVENKVIVPRYINEEIPIVVNQLIEPVVMETDENPVEVVVREYEPYLVPVDVFVPKPVERRIIACGQSNRHITIDVPPSQFNALVKAANAGATDQDVDSLLVKQLDGSIPMLNDPELRCVQPNRDDWRSTHQPGRLRLMNPPGQTFVYPNLTKDYGVRPFP